MWGLKRGPRRRAPILASAEVSRNHFFSLFIIPELVCGKILKSNFIQQSRDFHLDLVKYNCCKHGAILSSTCFFGVPLLSQKLWTYRCVPLVFRDSILELHTNSRNCGYGERPIPSVWVFRLPFPPEGSLSSAEAVGAGLRLGSRETSRGPSAEGCERRVSRDQIQWGRRKQGLLRG